MNKQKPDKTSNWQNNATRITATGFGILCGLTGLIAGFFEILQGNTATESLIVSTIGPEYAMWRTYGITELMETYSAITIIPNFLYTGITAIITSSIVTIFSIKSLHKKHGATIFFLLSITQLLVGGSFVMDLAIITTLVATRINKPLEWWKNYLSFKTRKRLAKTWTGSLIAYSIISATMLTTTILGVNEESYQEFLGILAGLMFIPLLLMIIGGFSKDIQRRENDN